MPAFLKALPPLNPLGFTPTELDPPLAQRLEGCHVVIRCPEAKRITASRIARLT